MSRTWVEARVWFLPTCSLWPFDISFWLLETSHVVVQGRAKQIAKSARNDLRPNAITSAAHQHKVIKLWYFQRYSPFFRFGVDIVGTLALSTHAVSAVSTGNRANVLWNNLLSVRLIAVYWLNKNNTLWFKQVITFHYYSEQTIFWMKSFFLFFYGLMKFHWGMSQKGWFGDWSVSCFDSIRSKPIKKV